MKITIDYFLTIDCKCVTQIRYFMAVLFDQLAFINNKQHLADDNLPYLRMCLMIEQLFRLVFGILYYH